MRAFAGLADRRRVDPDLSRLEHETLEAVARDEDPSVALEAEHGLGHLRGREHEERRVAHGQGTALDELAVHARAVLFGDAGERPERRAVAVAMEGVVASG